MSAKKVRNGQKKSGKGNKGGKRKPVIFAAVAAAAILIVAAVCVIESRYKDKMSAVEYGKPVDYEAEGYIELGKYKGIRYSVEVTDEDVNDEVESILEDAESYDKISGTAKEGDMVNIDYKCVADGSEIEDYTSENEITTIGDEDFFPEFDEAMPGMKTGESKDVTIKIPDDYGDELIDGKTAVFTITLNYICGAEIKQELTDEFVSDYSEGECTSVSGFNDYVRKTLYDDNMENLADNIWEKVLKKVKVKKYHAGELENAMEETEKSYENFAEFSGSSVDEVLESFGMTKDDMDEMGEEAALEKMAAKTIAAKENITLSDEEYKNLLIYFIEYENGEEKEKTIEEMEADYEEGYGENAKDAMLRENVKNRVKDWADVSGLM